MNEPEKRPADLFSFFRIKEGYHSNQDVVFGAIKRSEFLGFAIGFGLGLVLSGIFNIAGNSFQIITAVIGALVGVWYDRKYCIVKDDPLPDPLPDSLPESRPEPVEDSLPDPAPDEEDEEG